MNRKVAKMIKELVRQTGRTEKSLKREYYKLSAKDRYLMKKEMERALANPELMQQLIQAAMQATKSKTLQSEVVSPSEFEEIE